MSKYIKIASVEFDTKAKKGTPEANGIILKETINALNSLKNSGVDLVAFSESIESHQTLEQAEKVDNPGPFLKVFIQFCKTEQAHIAASLKIWENDKVYNTIVFIGPEGTVLGVYKKNYLVINEIEDIGLSPGNGPLVIDTAIGRLGGVICFDLNYEELRQKYRALKPDILIFSSTFVGDMLQNFWAYDCKCFWVAALPASRRFGCSIIDPMGCFVARGDQYTPILTATINLDRIVVHNDGNMVKFSAIRRKYGNEISIETHPNNLGVSIIYSCSEKHSAEDITKEFELELFDDYFKRSIMVNEENRGK
jgi:predicted amidohydrolase